jgi:hypothetical protein
MKTTRKKPSAGSADDIASLADEGKDVSRFFTNRGRMMGPIQSVNLDFALHDGGTRQGSPLAKREPAGGHQDAPAAGLDQD